MSQECRDIAKLHPKLQELAVAFLAECKRQGLTTVTIGETLRTAERQDYLYAQGRTRPGKIVTNATGKAKQSYHQWGLAFDIFNNVKGDLYNETVLKKAGQIGMSLGLEWGGSWTGFVDKPHFQFTFGLTIKQLNAGAKIPDYTLKDLDLMESVNMIIHTGIKINAASWNELEKIEIKNVPALLDKLGGINSLVEKKVIEDRQLWDDKKYNQNHVRSLITKYAHFIKESTKK